ncbi:MAG TPA: hypothetical protein VKZ92_09265 [Pseudohongiella sp.]|nr:hypothetical protein [Pseudohongiella sp.]
MPKAILALRNYPLALFVAMVLFVCSLVLATSSIGINIIGGDEGSGLGGTGKDGIPGSSGFGGTGGPFLGDTETIITDDQSDNNQDPANWPAPWLPREEVETAHIPDEIAPLIEIQRNPLRDPTRTPQESETEGQLRIIEEDTSSLPTHLRQQIDLANSPESFTESPALEIHLQIPEIEAPVPNANPALTENARTASVEAQAEPEEVEVPQAADTIEEAVEQRALADSSEQFAEEIPEIISETAQPVDPRNEAERIQRPELPPFQRLRPAVDRATVAPAGRPQPMRI